MSDQISVPDRGGNQVLVFGNRGDGNSNNGNGRWGSFGLIRPLIFIMILLVAVGYGLSLSWSYIGPKRPTLDNARRTWANRAAVQISEDVSANRGEFKTLVLCDFKGEPSGELNELIRESIEKKGSIDLFDKTLTQKVRHSLGFRPQPCNNKDAATKAASSAGAELALFGTCEKLENATMKTLVDIKYSLVDKTGKIIYDGQFENISENATAEASFLELPPEAKNLPWLHRLLGWILFALLLPVITISFLTIMTAKESNMINACVLITYTVISGIAAWLLMQPDFNSHIQTIIFVIMIFCSFLYNGQVMVTAKKMND